MPTFVSLLLRLGGVMIMTIRHRLVPPGRRMFETADETIRLAEMQDLRPVLNLHTESSQAVIVAGIT